jgi:hypothetical protein
MSSLEIPAPPVMAARRPPRTWYFLGTTVVGLVAYGTMILAQLATLLLLALRAEPVITTQAELQALVNQGGSIAAATIAACPFVLGVLWVAIRIARHRFASYLALRWPVRGALVRGLTISFAFLLAWDLLSYLVGQKTPDFVINSYRTAKDTGGVAAAADRVLRRRADHGRVRGARLPVSWLVAIVPRSHRRHLAVIGALGGDARAV